MFNTHIVRLKAIKSLKLLQYLVCQCYVQLQYVDVIINFVDMIGSNKLQDVHVLANITNKTNEYW